MSYSYRSNRQSCPVDGCSVIAFELVHDISGIGDDSIEIQTEFGSDNGYECQDCEHPECLCKRFDID